MTLNRLLVVKDHLKNVVSLVSRPDYVVLVSVLNDLVFALVFVCLQ